MARLNEKLASSAISGRVENHNLHRSIRLKERSLIPTLVRNFVLLVGLAKIVEVARLTGLTQ